MCSRRKENVKGLREHGNGRKKKKGSEINATTEMEKDEDRWKCTGKIDVEERYRHRKDRNTGKVERWRERTEEVGKFFFLDIDTYRYKYRKDSEV